MLSIVFEGKRMGKVDYIKRPILLRLCSKICIFIFIIVEFLATLDRCFCGWFLIIFLVIIGAFVGWVILPQGISGWIVNVNCLKILLPVVVIIRIEALISHRFLPHTRFNLLSTLTAPFAWLTWLVQVTRYLHLLACRTRPNLPQLLRHSAYFFRQAAAIGRNPFI